MNEDFNFDGEAEEEVKVAGLKFKRNQEIDDEMLYGVFIVETTNNNVRIALEELLSTLNKKELKLLIQRIKDMLHYG